MGRMKYIIMVMVALNIALLLFNCQKWDNVTGQCISGGVGESANTFWTFIQHPEQVDLSDFFNQTILSGIALLIGAGVLVGSFFIKSELPIFATIATVLFIAPMYSFINLYLLIQANDYFGDSGKIIAIIFVGAYFSIYILTLLDWVRGRD